MTSTPATPAALAAPGEMTPAACLALLKQTFPALFDGVYKPFKLRIQADIQERAPGVFTKQVLSAFFRRHTGSYGYLVALTKATHRFDLDGQPCAELSAEHKQAAQEELARRRTNERAREQQAEDGRRQRATLLRAFETTTLTPANFCALKGVAPEELDGLLAIARREAQERPPEPPRRPDGGERPGDRGRGRPDGRPGGRPEGRHGRPPEGGRGPAPAGPGGQRRQGQAPRQGQQAQQGQQDKPADEPKA